MVSSCSRVVSACWNNRRRGMSVRREDEFDMELN
jgi:hypothetical protein